MASFLSLSISFLGDESAFGQRVDDDGDEVINEIFNNDEDVEEEEEGENLFGDDMERLFFFFHAMVFSEIIIPNPN